MTDELRSFGITGVADANEAASRHRHLDASAVGRTKRTLSPNRVHLPVPRESVPLRDVRDIELRFTQRLADGGSAVADDTSSVVVTGLGRETEAEVRKILQT